MGTQKIIGNNGTDQGMYEFRTFHSDSSKEEDVDFKKEAKKIYTFIDNYLSGGTRSEIRGIYEKKLKPVDTKFMSILKTDKDCNFCNVEIKTGELAYFERMFTPYKHFKIMHPLCALKHWIQRLRANIEADAPQIILDDYSEVIGKVYSKVLKAVVENKQDIAPFIFK